MVFSSLGLGKSTAHEVSREPRIIFAGTPEFAATHLRALLSSGSEHSFKPIAVYTQPDRPAGRGRQPQASPVKQLALEHGIDCYQPSSLKSEEQQQILADLQPDLMIVVAYGLILPKAVLEIPVKGCINVHASLLPRWRGAAPIQRAIEAGDKGTAATIMQMDEGLDTGDIITIKAVNIGKDDTSATLHDRIAQAGSDALVEHLPFILGWLTPDQAPQKQTEEEVTYAHKLSKEEGIINWSEPAQIIDQKIRAFTPWPGSQTFLGEARLKINGRIHSDTSTNAQAGEIIAHTKQGLVICCGTGQLLVDQLQYPGKKMTPVTDLLNSNQDKLAVGQRFSNEP